MKKSNLFFALIFFPIAVFSQFSISMNIKNSTHKEVYVFGYNGTREILLTKSEKTTPIWKIEIKKAYKGIIKLYFPANSDSFNCISENKNIVLNVETNANAKLSNLNFEDVYNLSFLKLQNYTSRHKQVLPVLQSMKGFYSNQNEDFRKAIDKEILQLSTPELALADAIFTKYYFQIQTEFLNEKAVSSNPKAKELQSKIMKFIVNSDEMLESSTQLRQLLVQFLSYATTSSLESDVESLIKACDLHTSRGQNVLSELLDVFQAYEIVELQTKYLSEAKALTCTINDRLATTIRKTEDFMIGSKLPNVVFNLDTNKKYESIHAIKAKYKVVLFWASTCTHCMAEIPEIMKAYKGLKAKNIEIIGLSIDSDKKSYEDTAKNLDWINDSEFKGWNSSFLEKFNIMATPTFVIIDENNVIVAKPSKFHDVLQFLSTK